MRKLFLPAMLCAMSCTMLCAMLCTWASIGPAAAAEIKILSPGSTEAAFSELLPQFEKASGQIVKMTYGPAGALASRVAKGEAADIAILGEQQIQDLQKQGKLVPGAAATVAKVGIGVFVRRGDPKPEIGTLDAFLRALTGARTIAYADPKLGGSASILVGDMMKSLDITGAIGGKTRLVPPAKPLLDLVAGGGIDFGFNPIPEILSDARVQLVGPLPPELQKYTLYTAGLVHGSQQGEAYKAFTAFFSSPAAAVVMKARGFEPL
jgi:molybdate transport system substrate-binding protein